MSPKAFAKAAQALPGATMDVQWDDLAALDDAEVTGWLATWHELVAAKLTCKQGAEIGPA